MFILVQAMAGQVNHTPRTPQPSTAPPTTLFTPTSVNLRYDHLVYVVTYIRARYEQTSRDEARLPEPEPEPDSTTPTPMYSLSRFHCRPPPDCLPVEQLWIFPYAEPTTTKRFRVGHKQ